MPSLRLSADLELWYTSNAPHGDAAKFDHAARETILFFHPLFLDSTWLRPQFQDARLSDHYNLLAFDARSSGRTQNTVSPQRDAWVDAADVGLALERLGVPRCHVFAVQENAVHAAYRFALLFPDRLLSLCLCQIPAPVDFVSTVPAYFELLESWCFPPDLATVEHACAELSYLMFNKDIISSELEDEVVAWWQRNFPATRRTRLLENLLTAVSRQPLSDAMMQRIQVPVLVMHGEKYVVNPTSHAEAEAARLPHAQFIVIKGGPEAFTAVPACATVVNRVYTTFLARLARPPPAPPSPPPSPRSARSARGEQGPAGRGGVLAAALARLADVTGDPGVLARPRAAGPLGLSMCPAPRAAENAAHLARFGEGESGAFTALGKDGLPVRKMSTRHEDQWTEAAFAPVTPVTPVSPVAPVAPVAPTAGAGAGVGEKQGGQRHSVVLGKLGTFSWRGLRRGHAEAPPPPPPRKDGALVQQEVSFE